MNPVKGLRLWRIKVRFMQEHREWLAQDDSRHLGWAPCEQDYVVLAPAPFAGEGERCIRHWLDGMFAPISQARPNLPDRASCYEVLSLEHDRAFKLDAVLYFTSNVMLP
jgi:hypothetical protein